MASDIERAAFSRGVRSRDAEIAALKAEVAKRDRALAAGPAALRMMAEDYDRKVILGTVAGYHQREAGIIRSADLINAALHVEAAQEAAMKDDDHG